MQDENENIQIAVADIEKLDEFHNRFITTIAGLTELNTAAGKFGVINGEIHTTCLNIELRVEHKIVVSEGFPKFIEYSFIVPREDDDLIVFNMYLSHNGTLCIDHNMETKLCDFNNTYLADIVLNRIARKLLDSDAFAPSTNG